MEMKKGRALREGIENGVSMSKNTEIVSGKQPGVFAA
jgi:hypothetical protein